ncbi:hypothetical protein [Streptomyces sp. NPDC051219]|uniref:hypothetical protein n=1 Tax=Streptomyces sp. NPDC051219 TaxID=3155283 RepID=UPI003426CDA7
MRERARLLLADSLPTAGPRLGALAALILLVAGRRHGGFGRDLLERTLREVLRAAADDGDVVIQDLCAEAALSAVRNGA